MPGVGTSGERQLIPLMRAILWIGGFFVLVAGIQLWVFSGRTADYFAWTIASDITAAFIGSFYWAASVLALLSAREDTWARARLGVPGVLAFVWLTLLATLLHLDLFHLDEGSWTARAAAWTWLVIYVIEPPVLLAAFVLQLRAPGEDPPRTDPLPRGYRALLAVLGGLLVALGAAMFAAPSEAAEHWPWALTELTSRAIGAWTVAMGGLLLAIRWEDERSRIRLGSYVPTAFAALAAVAMARFADQVDFSSGGGIAVLALVAATGAAGLYGWRISTG
jgi:hypothetical protein